MISTITVLIIFFCFWKASKALRTTLKKNSIRWLLSVICSSKDITEKKQTEDTLWHRSTIDVSIAKVSKLFIRSDNVNYDTILEIMGKSVSVNRAYIFQIQKDGSKTSNIFEWCAHGTDPQIETLQNIGTNTLPWWIRQLQSGENIVITDVDKLPPEAVSEKEILQAQQIKSLVVVSIWSRQQVLWGFMGFDDTTKARQWDSFEIKPLQIVGEMISGDIKRKTVKDKLDFERRQLRSIVDSIDLMVYVADPKTHKILYVNQVMKDLFQKNLIGKICYREFHGFESPCDFCTNEIILKKNPTPIDGNSTIKRLAKPLPL
ncbi:MAG: GAF domain-containing protein [Desulfobacula sp.]|nr:GAF domain-containing protein [Desulfobacula sp.]